MKLSPRPSVSKAASFHSDLDSAYDPSDDGSYGVDVIKDVLSSASVSSISDEETSESSASDLEKDTEGFVDPFPDFQWMTTEEPHRSRRMAILKAHPEVSPFLLNSGNSKLMIGPEPHGTYKMDIPNSPFRALFPNSPILYPPQYLSISLDFPPHCLYPRWDIKPKHLLGNPRNHPQSSFQIYTRKQDAGYLVERFYWGTLRYGI